ncbi:phage antirepressor KilAC domain-containing protein [Sporosarcina obsidiansis]|uniref:phage antirepressor KilAC domain-containing protein n=1 Tax=Sporosarcina obsidiansis TaxID=2660748 RepID=UPI0018914CF1|nr:phage antirepressor KilAC domain-containing protein [Sporosarcina obsidiansis]
MEKYNFLTFKEVVEQITERGFKITQKQLRKKLLEWGLLYVTSGDIKLPTNKAVKHKYLVYFSEEVIARDCRSYPRHQTFVTEKGLEYFYERLKSEGC